MPPHRGTAFAVSEVVDQQPSAAQHDFLRERLPLRQELILAISPTLTILAVTAFVDALVRQRLLFSTLASSALLIYLEPGHNMNRVRTLVMSQIGCACIGLAALKTFGSGYVASSVAMTAAIFGMVIVDALHPPAVGTALSFALQGGGERNIIIFVLSCLILAALLCLRAVTLTLHDRFTHARKATVQT